MLREVMLCYATLCYTMLCYAARCYVVCCIEENIRKKERLGSRKEWQRQIHRFQTKLPLFRHNLVL